MEKRIYICDKCKTEFTDEKMLTSYWPLRVRTGSKHGNSEWTVSDGVRKEYVNVDLCKECEKLFIKRK